MLILNRLRDEQLLPKIKLLYCRLHGRQGSQLLLTPTGAPCLSHFKDGEDVVPDYICCRGKCQEDGAVFSEAAKIMTLLSVEQVIDGYTI